LKFPRANKARALKSKLEAGNCNGLDGKDPETRLVIRSWFHYEGGPTVIGP
jgi:hypothetical protein